MNYFIIFKQMSMATSLVAYSVYIMHRDIIYLYQEFDLVQDVVSGNKIKDTGIIQCVNVPSSSCMSTVIFQFRVVCCNILFLWQNCNVNIVSGIWQITIFLVLLHISSILGIQHDYERIFTKCIYFLQSAIQFSHRNSQTDLVTFHSQLTVSEQSNVQKRRINLSDFSQ